ncbi:MAG: hypothetical protein HP497_14590 [Nitrospira sp.]|nr:hypothetical protein [Nitrospira sp.]MBH0200613.1 hypothetical protein [Nitrospira sp.]
MVSLNLIGRLRAGLSVGLILLLMALAPFAVAQDVHHELAAADTDGHEHSDNDLCQWVQHHTAGSLDFDVPRPAFRELVEQYESPADPILLSVAFSYVGPSRAPPALH